MKNYNDFWKRKPATCACGHLWREHLIGKDGWRHECPHCCCEKYKKSKSVKLSAKQLTEIRKKVKQAWMN